MKFIKTGMIAAIAVTAISTPTFSDEAAIKARQGLMRIYAQNLGILGGMAKGDVEYNQETAAAAAARLLQAANFDQSAMWPQGSDNVAMAGKTATKPELWSTFPAVMESGKAFADAAKAMNDAAGTDLASLQGAMGAVGASCSACHKLYRQK